MRRGVGAVVAVAATVSACAGSGSGEAPRSIVQPVVAVDVAPAAAVEIAPVAVGDGPVDAGRAHGAAVDEAGNASAPAASPPFPAGSKVLAFREMLVGVLPAVGSRVTWRLGIGGSDAVLRIDAERSVQRLDVLDEKTLDDAAWRAAATTATTAYVGAVERASPLRVRVRRVGGEPARIGKGQPGIGGNARSYPAELVLDCAPKTVRAHSSAARLERATRDQDNARGRWVPATTQATAVTMCSVGAGGAMLPFTEGLAFAPALGDGAHPTLEWSFINSDMVIQDGGYRLVPAPR